MEIIQIVALIAALGALAFVVIVYCVGQVSRTQSAPSVKDHSEAVGRFFEEEKQRLKERHEEEFAMLVDYYKRTYGIEVRNISEATAFQLERTKELHKQDDSEAEDAKINPAAVSVIHFGKGKQAEPFIQWDNRLEMKDRGDIVDVKLAHIDSIRVKRHGDGVTWKRHYTSHSVAYIQGSIVSLRLISGREVDLHVNRHQTENLIASIVAATQEHLGKPLTVVKGAAL